MNKPTLIKSLRGCLAAALLTPLSASAGTVAEAGGSFVGQLDTPLLGSFQWGTYDIQSADLPLPDHGDLDASGQLDRVIHQILVQGNIAYEPATGALALGGTARVQVPPPNYASSTYTIELDKYVFDTEIGSGSLTGVLNLTANLQTDGDTDSALAEAYFKVFVIDSLSGEVNYLASHVVQADAATATFSDSLANEPVNVNLSGYDSFFVAWFGFASASVHVPETGSTLPLLAGLWLTAEALRRVRVKAR